MNSLIKLVKGSSEAFKNLKIKDPNTFYFISESNEEQGKLYLGSKQITCDFNGITKLEELLDIELPSVLINEQILAYNVNNEKWTVYQIEDLIKSIIDTNCLVMNKKGQLSFLGLESAAAGSAPVKSETGAIIWTKIKDEKLEKTVKILTETINTLQDQIKKLEEKLSIHNFNSYMTLNSEWTDIIVNNKKVLTSDLLKSMSLSSNGTFLIQVQIKELNAVFSGLFSWKVPAQAGEINNEILLQGCGDSAIYLRMVSSDKNKSQIKFQICSNQIEDIPVSMDIKIQHLI